MPNRFPTAPDTHTSLFDVTLDFAARMVTVEGELDLATAPRLLRATECMFLAPSGDLTIDLSRTSFLDPVGLTAFVTINNALQAHRRRLALVNLTTHQRRLFMITGLAGLLMSS